MGNEKPQQIQPALEVYYLGLRMLNSLDRMEGNNYKLNRAITVINEFVIGAGCLMEQIDTEAHERSVHNFNVIMNSITIPMLELPIGYLEVSGSAINLDVEINEES